MVTIQTSKNNIIHNLLILILKIEQNKGYSMPLFLTFPQNEKVT